MHVLYKNLSPGGFKNISLPSPNKLNLNKVRMNRLIIISKHINQLLHVIKTNINYIGHCY